MYGNFGITPHVSLYGSGYGVTPFSSLSRSSLLRPSASDSNVTERNLLANVRHYLGSMRSLLQYCCEFFTLFTSAYCSLMPIVTIVPKETLILYSKTFVFYSTIALLVFGIETLLNSLRAYIRRKLIEPSESRVAMVIYDFVAQNDMELSATEGDELSLLREKSGWCYVKVRSRSKRSEFEQNTEGWIPFSYLRVVSHKL